MIAQYKFYDDDIYVEENCCKIYINFSFVFFLIAEGSVSNVFVLFTLPCARNLKNKKK